MLFCVYGRDLHVGNLLCHDCFYLDDVLDIIQKEGFTILMQRQILLSEEEARTVCRNYESEEYFSKLLAYMSR